jgi:hypothetical protein
MSLVRPILEYGAACWDPYREGQISALDRVQKKAAKFAHHTRNIIHHLNSSVVYSYLLHHLKTLYCVHAAYLCNSYDC